MSCFVAMNCCVEKQNGTVYLEKISAIQLQAFSRNSSGCQTIFEVLIALCARPIDIPSSFAISMIVIPASLSFYHSQIRLPQYIGKMLVFSPYCRQVKDKAVILCFLTADFTYYVFDHPEPVEGSLPSSQAHARPPSCLRSTQPCQAARKVLLFA